MTSSTTTPTPTADVTEGPVLTLINKRIRNLRKKLNRISQLEDSIAQGKSAVKNKEQQDLLNTKPSLLAAVDELEKFRHPLCLAVDEEISLAVKNSVTVKHPSESVKSEGKDENEDLEDLVKLIYFGNMFDVKTQSEFNSVMLTRTLERNSCLTYDYVTDDDAAVMLGEGDLDLISMMSGLLISRPVDSEFSHEAALERCVQHAKLWVAKSETAIDSNSTVTYAALREKLTKIIGSDYFKIVPQMTASDIVAAEAAGSYGFQVPVQVESSVTQQEQMENHATELQRNETHEDQSSPAEDSPKQHEPEAENSTETQDQVEQGETNAVGTEFKEQHGPRRSYHNQRGGGRSSGVGGRNGGRGYGTGRGGRSGGRGGPYQNGRNQYYDQPGNYYPSNQRNYYGGRGRGGRGNAGGGNGYNHHASGVEAVES